MIDLPTDAYVSVIKLAQISGYTTRRIYEFIEQSPDTLSLDPHRKGIPASKALAWLQARQAKKTAWDAVERQLREVAEAGAKKATNKGVRKTPEAQEVAVGKGDA